ncbi:NRAMP (natural resistance-associated macrophage protein)-like metal ion transporter [Marinirhabdus gelatinilytica]|uniref:NRAMP (Natural resistance-associated macrophage protein)-like metal ion transporter n=2 Tax=Marinirhabdus gelatinilytica TaxID=1703343 RepID=A0A370QFX7_9FLAO|nr:NRAMP (natural resistance-associated macrophage protein)-like metal ion transporter [Marinirhabdus gelatinilytica]
MKNPLKNIGPGTLVAAAFIGPGTVTVCTLAGVSFGFELLWAMGLSIVATIVLQEMAARLGLVYGKGLAATVKEQIQTPWLRVAAILLIVSAILVGNAAYEAGNISGGVLGLQTIFKEAFVTLVGFQFNYLSLLIGVIAFTLLFIGNYKVIERSLVALVLLMSISFVVAAILTNPEWVNVLKGVFLPKFPSDSLLTIIALVGTTVVPYNLFLHASLVQEKWSGAQQLPAARKDLYISIVLGGLVSMAIIICAAGIEQQNIANAADLAKGLEPLYGEVSKYVLSLGLFAAGITSAITAPLAAAYVARDCFGWKKDLKSARFRVVWIGILGLGVVFSSIGFSSIEIIQFAQVANGLLLPIIAGFLLWVVNKKSVLGDVRNTTFQTIVGLLIVLATLILGLRSLYKVFF